LKVKMPVSVTLVLLVMSVLCAVPTLAALRFCGANWWLTGLLTFAFGGATFLMLALNYGSAERNCTCAKCGATLSDYYSHVNGQDWCTQHEPVAAPDYWIENVNGIIVGPHLRRYEFWVNEKLAGRFEAEAFDAAVEYFKQNFPAEFKIGGELREYI